MNLEILLSVIGGLCIGIKWMIEYTNKNNWDKNRFLLQQLDKFNTEESTIVIQKILDWNSTPIIINDIEYDVEDDDLYNILATNDTVFFFTEKEQILRNYFDNYFDNLTRFVFLVDMKVIDEKNFIKLMGYWLDILTGKRDVKEQTILKQLYKYLKYYDYDILHEYLKKYKIKKPNKNLFF